MSGTKTIISPVPYTVAHDSEDYPTEKIEIDLQDGQYRKRTVKVWSAKRGVEGLLFCFDAFKRQCVDKFNLMCRISKSIVNNFSSRLRCYVIKFSKCFPLFGAFFRRLHWLEDFEK
jgi:hypothetical protein